MGSNPTAPTNVAAAAWPPVGRPGELEAYLGWAREAATGSRSRVLELARGTGRIAAPRDPDYESVARTQLAIWVRELNPSLFRRLRTWLSMVRSEMNRRALCLCLLVAGVNAPRWRERGSAAAVGRLSAQPSR